MTRVIGTVISVAGFGGIFAVNSVFNSKMSTFIAEKGFHPVSYDNYQLFFKASTALTAIFLAMTLLSAATYVFQKEAPSKFTYFTVTTSPVICAVALLMISGFYSYLTHGSECTIFQYVMLTGLSEALLFALPYTITRAHKIAFDKTYKVKKQINKK